MRTKLGLRNHAIRNVTFVLFNAGPAKGSAKPFPVVEVSVSVPAVIIVVVVTSYCAR